MWRPKYRWARCKKACARSTTLHPIHCPRTWIEVRPMKTERWSYIALLNPGAAEYHCLGPFAPCLVLRPSKSRDTQHQHTERQKRAMRKCPHLRCLTSDTEGTVSAPSVEEFANLLQRIRRNKFDGGPPRTKRENKQTRQCRGVCTRPTRK